MVGRAVAIGVLVCQMGLATSAQAQTALPYTEVFGNLTTSGCDSAWDGACEVGWAGHGDDNSLEMVQLVDNTSVHGVMVKPGTSMPNGISRNFDVSGKAGYAMEVHLPVVAVEGYSTVGIRVVFKNSGGTTLSTYTETWTATDAHEFSVRAVVPNNAAIATVFYGAQNGESASTTVVLGWFPGTTSVPTHRVNPGPYTDQDQCPSYSGSCECDISCPPGEELQTDCNFEGPPKCSMSATCWCEQSDGECEFSDISEWF